MFVFNQYLSAEHSTAVKDQMIRFSFLDSKTGYIELELQESEVCRGWSIEPHMEPLKVNRSKYHFQSADIVIIISNSINIIPYL